MRFKQNVHVESGFNSMIIAPMINVLFLLLIFFVFMMSFARQLGVDIKLPKAITSNMITQQQMTVTISDENILYFNGVVVSTSELKEQLGILKHRQLPILIKADRRSSVGRVVDVWDLCRQLGLEKVNIAASQRE